MKQKIWENRRLFDSILVRSFWLTWLARIMYIVRGLFLYFMRSECTEYGKRINGIYTDRVQMQQLGDEAVISREIAVIRPSQTVSR